MGVAAISMTRPRATTNLLPGTYYVLVASQGQNLVNGCEGTGDSGYTLSQRG